MVPKDFFGVYKSATPASLLLIYQSTTIKKILQQNFFIHPHCVIARPVPPLFPLFNRITDSLPLLHVALKLTNLRETSP